jgi:hypothetical protein
LRVLISSLFTDAGERNFILRFELKERYTSPDEISAPALFTEANISGLIGFNVLQFMNAFELTSTIDFL